MSNMVFDSFIFVIVVGLLVALGPFLIFTLHRLQKNSLLWKIFFFGWAGWLFALAIRIVPVQLPAAFLGDQLGVHIPLTLAYFAFASLLAGIVEEGIRYLLLKKKKQLRANKKTLLSFGLGWGLGEAILLYLPAIITLPLVAQTVPSLFDILPGAIERNVAILLHISLTFLVFASLQSKKKHLLYLAMFLHFLVNMVATGLITLTKNVWLVEGAIIVLVLIIFFFVVKTYGNFLKPESKKKT